MSVGSRYKVCKLGRQDATQNDRTEFTLDHGMHLGEVPEDLQFTLGEQFVLMQAFVDLSQYSLWP